MENTYIWHIRGERDQQQGLPITACPYDAGTVGAVHWTRGWKEADGRSDEAHAGQYAAASTVHRNGLSGG